VLRQSTPYKSAQYYLGKSLKQVVFSMFLVMSAMIAPIVSHIAVAEEASVASAVTKVAAVAKQPDSIQIPA